MHCYSDYKEYNTDTCVHFIVILSRDKLVELERDGLHKAFKLQSTMTVTSMVRNVVIIYIKRLTLIISL